jgi:hypothetical protein
MKIPFDYTIANIYNPQNRKDVLPCSEDLKLEEPLSIAEGGSSLKELLAW